jgi:serine protease Do
MNDDQLTTEPSRAVQDLLPEQSPASPAPPFLCGSRLLWILLMLSMVLVTPYVAQRVQYALTYGRLRAQVDVATEELDRLAKTTELVSLADTSKVFRMVAQRIEPSVVHIDAAQGAGGRTTRISDEFPWLGPRGDVPRVVGQGSGVIVDASGYIITNFHVIQNSTSLAVKLSDGRTVDKITVVGADPLTDLAVLKIDADGLIAATWGDSQALEAGDWVLAVGNPYGLDGSVTSGIVSAKQRRRLAQQSIYQDFLQTDAAVNPGNSGGPLVNVKGEIVGITTAIVGRSYQGISFAIPSEIARDVYERLVKNGRVARGWLGVAPGDVTPDVVRQLGLREARGALVRMVEPDSPAQQAGVERGDVILQWDGQAVADPTELVLAIGRTKIGSTVKVRIWRSGGEIDLQVTVAERPPDLPQG